MASEQQRQMNELHGSIKERLSNPDVDLATRQERHSFKPNRAPVCALTIRQQLRGTFGSFLGIVVLLSRTIGK